MVNNEQHGACVFFLFGETENNRAGRLFRPLVAHTHRGLSRAGLLVALSTALAGWVAQRVTDSIIARINPRNRG